MFVYYKYCIMIELTFLKDLILIKQLYQKSAIFVFLKLQSINLSDAAFLNIKGSDCLCIISLISKNQAIDLIQNADLTGKTEHYKEQKICFKKYLEISKLKKNKCYHHKTPIFWEMLILRKYLTKFSLVKKTINTLLVTFIMVIKLNH